jgi:hypothetical protein
MSYLRGLVRKTQAPRPQIAPRTAPLGSPVGVPIGLGLDEIVGEVVVTAGAQAAPGARLAPAAVPPRAPARAAPGPGLSEEPTAAERDPDDDAIVPAASDRRADAPRRPRAAEPPPLPSVSQPARANRRRPAASPPDDVVRHGAPEAPLAADRDPHPIVAASAQRPIVRPPAPPRRVAHAEPVVAPSPRRDRRDARPEVQVSGPDVQISIGRLELRANVTAPAKAERPSAFRPHLTLQDYLARKSRGQ